MLAIVDSHAAGVNSCLKGNNTLNLC